jgi:mRNA-degrading endonuclease RelE of RelBE toxin-antitoxin system
VAWSVFFKKSARKDAEKLPKQLFSVLMSLVHEIELAGPLRHNWRNFGKLRGTENCYHCHIYDGRPTYVVCWEVIDKKVNIVEVYYVGTHEKAPY